MRQAIDATGRVTQLQDALNSNLNALAGSKNFEDTVMSLAAAIHLLNSRLGATNSEAGVQLEGKQLDASAKGRAA